MRFAIGVHGGDQLNGTALRRFMVTSMLPETDGSGSAPTARDPGSKGVRSTPDAPSRKSGTVKTHTVAVADVLGAVGTSSRPWSKCGNRS